MTHDGRARFYMFSPDVAGEIRRFYLLPEESYTLRDLAGIWRMPPEDVCAIFSDDLATASSDIERAPDLFRVSWQSAVHAAHAFHVFRPLDVEIALGDDFEQVRGSRWRTVPLLIHLPRCVVDALRLLPLTPPYDSISARAERLLCETVEADLSLARPLVTEK